MLVGSSRSTPPAIPIRQFVADGHRDARLDSSIDGGHPGSDVASHRPAVDTNAYLPHGGLLKGIKDSPPQAEAISLEQRRLNVAGNFDCRGNAAGAKVILIDDVATTGSTLSACAEALKRAGAGSVWGLTLAREV